MKKILFAFMAFMLAFTSCQQSAGSDDTGVSPVTETPANNGGNGTQWNLVASVIKHENGVGKNDGAFHGTITLNKAKANTGDTVTITVTPDSGYELGELFFGPRSGEKQSIGKVNSFTMPNYAVEVTARFDPVDGYTVNLVGDGVGEGFIRKYDNKTYKKFKVGDDAYFTVGKDYHLNVADWKITIDGEDISSKFSSTTTDTNYSFKMPAHDVVVECN